jgi:hypothetical protein
MTGADPVACFLFAGVSAETTATGKEACSSPTPSNASALLACFHSLQNRVICEDLGNKNHEGIRERRRSCYSITPLKHQLLSGTAYLCVSGTCIAWSNEPRPSKFIGSEDQQQ